MIKDFNKKFGFPIRLTPQVPSDDEVRQRCRLKVEEVLEQVDACFDLTPSMCHLMKTIKSNIEFLLNNAIVAVELDELVDALGDQSYLLMGDTLSFGVNMVPILKLVHDTNLQKLPATTPGGKPVKPPGWKPPDIRSELTRQGWKP